MSGTCHICGEVGPLSFEHVPPKMAFNNKPVVEYKLVQLLNRHPADYENEKGLVQQRGVGKHTLCEKCNNLTGHWYGQSYINWVWQALVILNRSAGTPSLFYLFHIFPLRVLKQIIAMFFSVNSPGFAEKHPELVDFVLCRDRRFLRSTVKIFAFYSLSKAIRTSGASGILALNKGSFLISEIVYPPFGFVMTHDSEIHDGRLVEITPFESYEYNQFVSLDLKLPVLPVTTYFPGDYRSAGDVKAD